MARFTTTFEVPGRGRVVTALDPRRSRKGTGRDNPCVALVARIGTSLLRHLRGNRRRASLVAQLAALLREGARLHGIAGHTGTRSITGGKKRTAFPAAGVAAVLQDLDRTGEIGMR